MFTVVFGAMGSVPVFIATHNVVVSLLVLGFTTLVSALGGGLVVWYESRKDPSLAKLDEAIPPRSASW